MMPYAELLMVDFHARERELIAKADQHRLLTIARRARRVRAHRGADTAARREATLSPCAPRVAASAP
jgi:hypothetical protein